MPLYLRLIAVLLLCVSAFAQAPDAPSAIQPPAPAAKVSIWHQNWYDYYATHHLSNREVLSSKSFWATFLGDVAISSFDAEISHAGLAHHRCGEANGNTSRWQLYRYNLPENAAVAVVAFVWVKAKGPKYVLPAFLARPAYVHIKAGAQWYEQCW